MAEPCEYIIDDAQQANLAACAEYLCLASMESRDANGKRVFLHMDKAYAEKAINAVFLQWKKENGL